MGLMTKSPSRITVKKQKLHYAEGSEQKIKISKNPLGTLQDFFLMYLRFLCTAYV